MSSQSYKDLLVWQKSLDLCVSTYQACSAFPRTELYSLSDQMKRAAVSVSSNIAEGQARNSLGSFIHFLYIANGSLAELDTQRSIALKLGFLSGDCSNLLDNQITEIRKMLYSLTARLKSKRQEELKTEN